MKGKKGIPFLKCLMFSMYNMSLIENLNSSSKEHWLILLLNLGKNSSKSGYTLFSKFTSIKEKLLRLLKWWRLWSKVLRLFDDT